MAIVGGYFWELEGLLLGSITSLITIVYIWKPYFLFKKGFKMSVWVYWLNFLKFICLSITTMIIFKLMNTFIQIEYNNDWFVFILYAAYIGISFAIIQFIVLYCGTAGMKCLVQRILKK